MHGYGIKNYLNTRYPFPVDAPTVPLEGAVGCYRRTFSVPNDWKKKHENYPGIPVHYEGESIQNEHVPKYAKGTSFELS